MHRRHAILLCFVVALPGLAADKARAVMGGQTIMERVDTNGDHKLSLAEVRSAAARRYDLIERKNGGRVTMLQLGGRLVPADLKAVGGTPGATTPVDKGQYLSLVDKFFDDADAHRKAGDAPGSGRLVEGDLSTPPGKKLVRLLE